MQKNPVSHFILCFIFIWSVEKMTSGTGYALRMMDYWRETEVQEPRSHGRFAPEVEVLRWVCFDWDSLHKLGLPHASENSLLWQHFNKALTMLL